jgi:dTDP-4-amino-4,6-dideoxygalactose transaminase
LSSPLSTQAPPRVEFYKHQLGSTEAESWQAVLDTLFLTLGPQVSAFEQELGQFLVRDREQEPPTVVGTNSCSMGLLMCLAAFDVKPGDEVITTPMTFASTTNAILHIGATPVLVDVEPDTGLIDPERVRAAVGPKTRGIMPVHLYGQLADMRALRAIADEHKLFIIEDSAHGIEMERNGLRPSELGDCAVFSFYATKNLTSGDGGAIATRNPKIAERLRRLRNHGVSKAASERHGDQYQHWDLVELGYKGNLTDLDAALLRPQLPLALEKRTARQRIAEHYEGTLAAKIPFFADYSGSRVTPLIARRGQSTHHLFSVHVPAKHRDFILSALGKAGVGTAVNYRAIHTLTYLKERLALPRGTLPIAEEMGDRTISLPMYPQLTLREVDRVVQALADAFAAAEARG